MKMGTRGGSSKLIERGCYRVKGAYPMSRARATIMLEFLHIGPYADILKGGFFFPPLSHKI